MCKKHIKWSLLSSLCLGLLTSCNQQTVPVIENNKTPVIDLTSEVFSGLPKKSNQSVIDVIHLKGKVRYFGLDILQNPPQPRPLIGIPDVHVWIADYPFTKSINIKTDADGFWEVILLKPSCVTLNLSFAYEKDFYPENVEKMVFPSGIPSPWNKTTICSNEHSIESDDVTDIAAQMPDEIFLYYAKTRVEGAISAKIGMPYSMSNIVVTTVGKSWASIYDSRLPHGDAGASVLLNPTQTSPLQGPIYFDETVTPNPAMSSTSIDGGVLFNSLPPGAYIMTAQKSPYSYSSIKFDVNDFFNLYISSPPHSIQSSNESGPGE